ncbi:MAG: D-alanyl-D-alanine carboxypeptidase [Flavobacteriaceae bacterium]
MKKKVNRRLDVQSLRNHHIGFLVIDPSNRDTIYKRASTRYFTPASNVKIFTLFTALKLVPENLPTLKYISAGDTIYFEGLGNPATLHRHFNDSTALKFLSQFSTLYLNTSNISDPPYAAGWAWEDFDQPFAVARSSMPLYGNTALLYPNDGIKIHPGYFKDSLSMAESHFKRSHHRNMFYAPIEMNDSLRIPLSMQAGLTEALLEFGLGKKIHSIELMPEGEKQRLFGISRDSVLIRMMLESDNFLAEQLLLTASSVLSDTLSSRTSMDYIRENALSGLKQQPRWVDGSGLSRYNLFTPESLVSILHNMLMEFGETYILEFFPTGGVSGTLEDYYHGSPEPYVFAKSGTMGNIYCISGYLRANSGRLLIFSIMNNGFTISHQRLRDEIQIVLELIRDSN